MSIVSKIISMPKMTLVPVEGPHKWIPIVTMYNPTSLSFTKKAKFGSQDPNNKAQGAVLPEEIQFQGEDPIDLSLDFFFDYYEEQKDVRPYVREILSLTEAQDIDGNDVPDDNSKKQDNRPPRVLFVWRDTNPLGTGEPYCAVITSVKTDYVMFLDDGTPCRAKVSISCQQAALLKALEKFNKVTGIVVTTAGLTAAAIENLKGGRAALESAGGKIEDPSTWPASIVVEV